MTQNVLVPDIGDFESVEIIEVLVKSGDQINLDDPIVTLESDKSSVEVPSPFAGKIIELSVKVGDKVSKGSLLAKIDNELSNNEKIKTAQNKEVIHTKRETIVEEENSIQENSIRKVFVQPSSKDDVDPLETKEWIESLNSVIENDGPA